MIWVVTAAGGIAFAPFVGSVIGYFFRNISQRSYDAVIGFSSGIMLCAAVFGLIEPAISSGNAKSALTVTAGIAAGAVFLCVVDKVVPDINKSVGIVAENEQGRVLLLVSAIAIHHFPEGIAAGVSFGNGDASEIILVCTGIAIQNIPEGSAVAFSMFTNNASKKKAFWYSAGVAVIEIPAGIVAYLIGTCISAVLPYMLAFAGATMIIISCAELMPEAICANKNKALVWMLVGFVLMMILDLALG